jgi:amino-acid N-acetyltransferase
MRAVIERAVPADVGDVLRLLTDSRLPIDGLADHIQTTLVARKEGRVVGSAALEVYADGALLRSVAVTSSLRGEGFGQELTQAALRLAADLRAPAVYLLTTTAEGFFPRFGFETISRTQVPQLVRRSVEFASACPSSATVMRKSLSESLSTA